MKLAFSTLGCPDWTLDDIVTNAAKYGFSGIGIRGIRGEMDFGKIPAFSMEERENTRRKFRGAGLDVYMLLSSSRFSSPDAAERAKNLEAAKQVMDLGQFLGSKLVRVFGGKIADGVRKDDAYGWIVDSFRRLGDHGAKIGVAAALEMHDDFTGSAACHEILERSDHPYVQLLWDTHHPYRTSGEKMADTWKAIGKWVVDTHFKDSVPDATERLGYRYTLMGEGDVPNLEALQILKRNGFQGYLCLEWEKAWHAYLPDAHIAFPQYVSTMREYLSQLK